MYVQKVYIYPSGYASNIPPRFPGDANSYLDVYSFDGYLKHKTLDIYRKYVRILPQELGEWEEVTDNFD